MRRRRRGRGRGMNRFAALLDRLSYEPARNGKLRLIADYFRSRARSRPRLCARGAHRRAVVPARQGRAYPHADRRAHRPGAVRDVLRLRRRPVGDGGADVAGANSPRSVFTPPPRAVGGVGGGGIRCAHSSVASDEAPPTPNPSPPRAPRVGEGSALRCAERQRPPSPTSSPPSPPSANPNCPRNSRAGSTSSTRPAAGRC